MNVRRRLIPAAAAAGAITLGLTALTACSGSTSADGKGEDGRLKVVASFYPMQFLAEQIGGDHVSVTTLTKPGVEPHDLELKPRQTAELNEAGYILYLKGIQPAVDKAISQSGAEHKVDAATLTTLENHGPEVGHDHEGEGHTDEPGHEGEAHADEQGHQEGGHSEEGHADEGHEAEGHGDPALADPHIWLDPVKYAEVAEKVGETLGKADPDHAADYAKNADALVKKLDALHTQFADGLKNTSTRTFITTHSAFGYLAERYGLVQESIAGLSPESDPSPARVKELQETAEKDKVTTVFFETLASDKTARTLAGDTGLKTDVLDPLEGITDRSKGDDYIEVMEANLTALKKALGAK
ncbi:metal ABC transporter substrate-binding protein [Streptomyces sp. HNM0663]|uniref:Metal ABC transporter substrate-binding protein n=1 Tax=Streptomyces chengmaiensis TaxID=3040919 RepID=A0ABT6HSK5_9ACTN|nr:metal ABC transporter substrate-binding protein [Streptomyces chengmaiensis]MDH2391307.1 metal ABC transporter substrate-binding protein [Streptomyces chengmaiensis]